MNFGKDMMKSLIRKFLAITINSGRDEHETRMTGDAFLTDPLAADVSQGQKSCESLCQCSNAKYPDWVGAC